MEKVSLPVDVRDSKKPPNRSFSLSRNKKSKLETVHKQFVQVSGRCGAEFLGYFLKRFTHLF